MAVEYRSIDGFPGYEIGDDGTVWSTHIEYGKGGLGGARHQLKPVNGNSKGYKVVSLCKNGKITQRSIAELVLEAFVGHRPDGYDICHFPNRDPSDNRLCNLRYDTRSANHMDKVFHGTSNRGEKNNTTKLTRDQVREIRKRAESGELPSRIHNDFPQITLQAILLIVKRKNWGWLP